VRILAVGITGNIDRNELKQIANGVDNHVFTVKTFKDLPSIMKDLVQKTCDTRKSNSTD
jgi:riboflavin synthase